MMILLAWNRDVPDTWDDYDKFYGAFLRGKQGRISWSVGRHVNIPKGTACYMITQGNRHPRGLIACGRTVGPVKEGTHYADETKTTNYIRWVVEGMLPFDEVIPVSVVAERVPGIPWLTGIPQSGFFVPQHQEQALRDTWTAFGGDCVRLLPVQRKPGLSATASGSPSQYTLRKIALYQPQWGEAANAPHDLPPPTASVETASRNSWTFMNGLPP